MLQAMPAGTSEMPLGRRTKGCCDGNRAHEPSVQEPPESAAGLESQVSMPVISSPSDGPFEAD